MGLFLIDYPMVAAGGSIAPVRMETRREEVIAEIQTLLRAHRHLVHTKLVADFTAIGDAIYLRVELELNHQSKLPFEGKIQDHEVLESERELLKNEAMSLQQRIDRLAVYVRGDHQHRSFQKVDEDSNLLLKVVKAYAGISLKVRFHHDDLVLNFPEIPPFNFGRAQVVEVKVLKILDGNKVQLAIKADPSSKKFKKYEGLCQFRQGDSVDQIHMVIAFSKRMCRPIRMRIRPVFRIGEDTPCHYQVLDLPDFHSLHREILDFMNSRVDSDL